MGKSTKYVALDIHKESITVAVACKGQKTPRHYGAIPATEEALAKLCGNLGGSETSLRFCYEAGPCGYGVYRQLVGLGHECVVVAPSLIPRRPGDHIKTDRRDALSLSRLFKNGELTPVWVPDEAQEAMRDLERSREDFKHAERRVRQRLTSFLLRHGRHYGGRSRWSHSPLSLAGEAAFCASGAADRLSGIRRRGAGSAGTHQGAGSGTAAHARAVVAGG